MFINKHLGYKDFVVCDLAVFVDWNSIYFHEIWMNFLNCLEKLASVKIFHHPNSIFLC